MSSKIIASGISVSPGIVKGRAKVLGKMEDLDNVVQGDILVLPNSHPVYAIALMKASAVICEIGGMLSHICTVAMEMGIPCITQANGAMSNIVDGQLIYVDANDGVIYADE